MSRTFRGLSLPGTDSRCEIGRMLDGRTDAFKGVMFTCWKETCQRIIIVTLLSSGKKHARYGNAIT
jgi:hypothetical protein